MKIGTLTVEIGADTSGLDRGVSESKDKLSSLGSTAKVAAGALAAVGVAAATAAAVGLANIVSETIEAIEAQADLAAQLNTTVVSMAALERAGGLAGVSMQQISAAGRMLSFNLSKAATDGASPAAEALARLKLSAEALQNVPLDQRIATINAAIQEFIPASQQAAVAADLFGAKNALAISLLDSDVIAEARRQTELFGTALNQIDKEKVAQARDAMDVFGMAVDGVKNKLAVELSPILNQISQDFLKAAESSNGFGNEVREALDSTLEVARHVMNFVDGIGRSFEILAKFIVLEFQRVVVLVGGALTTLVETANSALQAVNIDALSGAADTMRNKFDGHMAVMLEAAKGFNEAFERPLSGDRFIGYVEDARAASQAAAELAVKNAPLAQGGEAGDGTRSPVPGLNMEAWLAEQDMFEQLRADMGQRQLDFENQLALDSISNSKAWSEENLRIKEQEAKREQQIQAKRRSDAQQFLGHMSTMMNGESRKMFEIGKAAAIANSIISGIEAAVHSYKFGAQIGGPYLGAAFAAASSLATMSQINAIRSQSFGGGGSSGGGSAGAASATQAANAATTPVMGGGRGTSTTYSISGLNPSEMFSGGQIRALMTRMNEERRDGSRLEFAD